jgi:hypothetical protein
MTHQEGGNDTSQAAAAAAAAASGSNGNGRMDRPSIHVDVQVHISPDASAQIDAIFASMARHLYAKQS